MMMVTTGAGDELSTVFVDVEVVAAGVLTPDEKSWSLPPQFVRVIVSVSEWAELQATTNMLVEHKQSIKIFDSLCGNKFHIMFS